MDMEKQLVGREAHHRACSLASEVGASLLSYKYAPACLRTYRTRPANVYRAPNPYGARFELPEQTGVAFPTDTHLPQPIRSLKRRFSAQSSDHDSPLSSRLIYCNFEAEHILDLRGLSTQFQAIRRRQIKQKVIFGPPNSNRNHQDSNNLCQPLTLQQQSNVPGLGPLTRPQPTQQQQAYRQSQPTQPMSILERAGMGILNTAKALFSIPLKLISRPQEQPPVLNVPVSSDGQELLVAEGIQAPKRRRLTEQQDDTVQEEGSVSEEESDGNNTDDGRDDDWTLKHRPFNEVAKHHADPPSCTDINNITHRDENIEMTDPSDVHASLDIGNVRISPASNIVRTSLDADDAHTTIQPSARITTSPTDAAPGVLSKALSGGPYSKLPEDFRYDMECTRQICHEIFDTAYEEEKQAIFRKRDQSPPFLKRTKHPESSKKATLAVSRVSHKRPGFLYKDPRDFFDNEDKHSIANVGSLNPNPRRIDEDRRAREAAELEELKEAEARRRQEADAQLAHLGLRTAHTPFIVPLTSEWEAKVTAATRQSSGSVKTCAPESIDFSTRDFLRMVPRTTWLNDSCVQAATQYGADYINKAAGITIKKDTPKCVALNSFFWSQLVTNGPKGKERMLKRVWGLTPQNFLDVESIIIPINERAHWTFVLIRPQRREIAYVDSFQVSDQERVDRIRQFVEVFLGDKYVEEDWKEVEFESPLQTNAYDCGMFVVTNSIMLALGLNPNTYDQEELALQRRRIAAVILNGGFHGDFTLASL